MIKKIMIVDDEKDIPDLFVQRFRKELKNGDLEFIFADSGEDALKKLGVYGTNAVLILSDINMPGMSGLELLNRIKRDHPTPPPIVMMITAYGDPETKAKATELGADDFLIKPIDFISLKEKLNHLQV